VSVAGDVTIREATSLDDLAAMLRVFEAVWGPEGQPPLNVTRAIHHAGGYAALAERDDRVVGASLGFIGRAAAGDMLLHSHITGAVPDSTDQGIGFLLKQHQRRWCLDRDIGTITWTFDPLVRRNAYFNLTKLGAVATSYHADFYGSMPDEVNGGDETDRVVATWDVTSERSTDATAPPGSVVVLDIGEDGGPVPRDERGDVLLLALPGDYQALRRRDPATGLAWRRAVRKTMGAALRDGYIGTGVTTEGSYVLRRADA
jgi:predicted GNAT superfamily acetyltransferase